MKKIISAAALMLVCSGVFAQFNQGRILAGGSVSFSTTTAKRESGGTTTTDGKSTNFQIAPGIGYFIINNLAVGASLNLSTGSYKFDGIDRKTSNTGAQIVPFARYYLDPGVFFQAQLGGGTASSKDKNGNTTRTDKYSIIVWGVGAGYAYFLNDFVAIEPIISYLWTSSKNKTSSVKDLNSGIALAIALQVYLGARN